MEEINESIIHGVAYRFLPSVNLIFMFIWYVFAAYWTINTFRNRHFQANKLQWALAAVPLIKSLQLTLSFIFWYSCFYLHACSLWLSFGVFVTRVLFHTSTLLSFLLISHGYSITCERLSVAERRTTAALMCLFYLTLIGYQASISYFSGLVLLNYFITFYVILRHVSQNLLVLKEQLNIIENEDIHALHDGVITKYIMFRKFQLAMHILAIAEIAIFLNTDSSSENSWLRLIVREWAYFFIFVYVGWTFRSNGLASGFSVMPVLKKRRQNVVPPIYSLEVDAATYKEFRSHKWYIGVPTSFQKGHSPDSVIVLIQHPCGVVAPINYPSARTVAVSTSNSTKGSNSFSDTNELSSCRRC